MLPPQTPCLRSSSLSIKCNFSKAVWLKTLFLHQSVGDWVCTHYLYIPVILDEYQYSMTYQVNMWQCMHWFACLCTIYACVHKILFAAEHKPVIANPCFIHIIHYPKMRSACFAFPLSGNLCWPYWGCWKKNWFRMQLSFVSAGFKASGSQEQIQWIQIVRLLKAQICPGLKLYIYSHVEILTVPSY